MNSKSLRWLEPQPLLQAKPIGEDHPSIAPRSLTKHFNQSQIEFIEQHVVLDCPDLSAMGPDQVTEFFACAGGIDDAKIILTFIVQHYVGCRAETEGSLHGNLKVFWYRKLAPSLRRLGRLGLPVTTASSRARYLLETMADCFAQLFQCGPYADLAEALHPPPWPRAGDTKESHEEE